MNRRRFLSVSAAFAAMPLAATAAPHRWRGRALGAEAEIVLHGDRDAAQMALREVEGILREVEAKFSLYDPKSELSRLNEQGAARLSEPFLEVVRLSDRLHRVTGGLFDPTVQPHWRALFEGRTPPEGAVGWGRVTLDGAEVALAPGQALTFNGIAQGYATDLVADALRARGFGEILVNVGEFSGQGRLWRIGVSDPRHGLLGMRTLVNGAIATSSPGAMSLGAGGHILHPAGGAAVWSTVSVEAVSAAVADGLSTALCLASEDQIAAIRQHLPEVRRITLVDGEGNLRSA